ncbi:hypothetical protein LZ30DRAFT_729144 [Colletotrichum cereale]|nr:hypothetical protein LZ30DRAFT_729144 [Colletotrichum cereale]
MGLPAKRLLLLMAAYGCIGEAKQPPPPSPPSTPRYHALYLSEDSRCGNEKHVWGRAAGRRRLRRRRMRGVWRMRAQPAHRPLGSPAVIVMEERETRCRDGPSLDVCSNEGPYSQKFHARLPHMPRTVSQANG